MKNNKTEEIQRRDGKRKVKLKLLPEVHTANNVSLIVTQTKQPI